MAKKGPDGLTPNQHAVLSLSRLLKKPSEIAEATGISLSQVSNLKSKLVRMGYDLPRFTTPSELMPPKTVKAPKPIQVRTYCKCGLSNPCNDCTYSPEYKDRMALGLNRAGTAQRKTGPDEDQELNEGWERFDSQSEYFNGGLDRPEAGFAAGPGYAKDVRR